MPMLNLDFACELLLIILGACDKIPMHINALLCMSTCIESRILYHTGEKKRRNRRQTGFNLELEFYIMLTVSGSKSG